jgi:hypothetical protein
VISKLKVNWIGLIFRRNCLLRQFIEGKVKGGIIMTGRRGRRRRNLPDILKGRGGYSHLLEEALDRTMCRARFGRGFGPVVRDNEWSLMRFFWAEKCSIFQKKVLLYNWFVVVFDILLFHQKYYLRSTFNNLPVHDPQQPHWTQLYSDQNKKQFVFPHLHCDTNHCLQT